MAKKTQAQQAPPAEPPKPNRHFHTKASFRVEKLSQYEFQAYKAMHLEDGTFKEEPFGKPTLFTLVMRRVFEAINVEANEVFNKNKVLVKEQIPSLEK